MQNSRATVWTTVAFPGDLPEGTVFLSHTPSFSSLSRISQLNMPAFSRLYSSIFFSTSGVVTCFNKNNPERKQGLYSWGTGRGSTIKEGGKGGKGREERDDGEKGYSKKAVQRKTAQHLGPYLDRTSCHLFWKWSLGRPAWSKAAKSRIWYDSWQTV